MYGYFGTTYSVRAVAVGCTVAAIVCTVAAARPKSFPLLHISFPFAAAALAADTSTITITQADAAGASAIVTSIDDVHSQADIVAYADGLMRADHAISQITISDQSISMSYQTSNRILNVQPVSGTTQATVDTDGSVSISGSWYRPLLTHTAQASSPNAGFSDIVMAQAGSEFSPSTQARILSRLHGRFQIGAIQ